MKQTILSVVIAGALVAPMVPVPAQALSCLAVDEYLKSVVGDENITIFVGTAKEQFEEKDYTAEVLTVKEVWQGYAEDEVFAYHEKSMEWGYLCNAGPGDEGEEGVYIANRDGFGKLNVYQRLSIADPLVITLQADIDKAEVEGSLAEGTATDRMNQIMTAVADLFKQMGILLKEYVYWKAQ